MVPFPVGLPADSDGTLLVRVSVQLPTNAGAPTIVEQRIAGGARRMAETAGASRTLWSSRAPLPMIATITGLLVCVWGTYAFVIGQLVAMRRLEAVPATRAFGSSGNVGAPG